MPVGTKVGTGVGSRVGVGVGDEVGPAVGMPVGTVVGEAVSTHVPSATNSGSRNWYPSIHSQMKPWPNASFAYRTLLLSDDGTHCPYLMSQLCPPFSQACIIVGTAVGVKVGAGEEAAEGTWVGLAEGATVGAWEGTRDGLLDGVRVGA
jgi:hypothetical protein